MKFNPGLKIGTEITNERMRIIFKCGNMGGMRRSKATGTLVLVSDDTKGLYRDEWENGILHYTGMGKIGDQVLEGNQNKNLYYSESNGIEVHLFEVIEKSVYTYRGVVTLADEPYMAEQVDEAGMPRKVWIFPLKLADETVEEIEKTPENEINGLPTRELLRRSSVMTH